MRDSENAHRREVEVARHEQRRPPDHAQAETVGPEIEDLPLGVPAEPCEDDYRELPGFPRGDPTHG